MSRRIRHALIKKIKADQWVRRPGGNWPERTIGEMIQWLKLIPGTDTYCMFSEGFMIVTSYRQKERRWVHRLTDTGSIHNVYVEIGEDEL